MMNYKDIFYLILSSYTMECDDDLEDRLSCRGCSNYLLCNLYRISLDKIWKGEY